MENILKHLGRVTLKSLLENPSLLQSSSPVLLRHPDDASAVANNVSPGMDGGRNYKDGNATGTEDLEKKLKEVEGDFFEPTDFGAAFLGPNLWERTYGDDDFNYKLEYMELDEFLTENGLPINTVENLLSKDNDGSQEGSEDGDEGSQEVSEETASPECTNSVERETTPVHVDVSFDLSPTDVALSTVPGQDVYDPRKRTFTEEELKPQPMIKKSHKVYVLPDQKDDRYWDRRRKNNIAAKRSRDARRIKVNQISMRAAFLEKENGALRCELLALKKENCNLKTAVKGYESKLGIK